MRGLARFKPSPAMVVALVALFAAVGGVSYAAAKIGSAQIKNNSVRSKDIHNHTIAGIDVKKNSLGGSSIRESKLGTVPRVATLRNFAIKSAPAAADEATAPKVIVGTKGPFQFYGKCFVTPAAPPTPIQVHAKMYLAIASGTGLFDTESEDDGVITPATPETDRVLQDAAANPDTVKAGVGDKDFMATDGVKVYTGVIGLAAAKQGAPPSGDAPF